METSLEARIKYCSKVVLSSYSKRGSGRPLFVLGISTLMPMVHRKLRSTSLETCDEACVPRSARFAW